MNETDSYALFVRKRAAIKAKQTTFKKFVDNFKASVRDGSLEGLSKSKMNDLELRVERHEKVLNEFEEIQAQIEVVCEDLDSQMIEREEFDNVYFSLLASCKAMISEYYDANQQSIKASRTDPSYFTSSGVDMLLGAEFFYELLCIGQIRLGKNLPTLQKTVLGWVLSSPIPFVQPLQQTTCHLTTNQEIHHLLTKFWEIEEPLVTKNLQFSSEEQICEDIFQASTKRASDGNSRETAIRRLRSIESKLSKDTELRLQYETFLKTYQSMGHMEDIPSSNVPQNSHFLPHHAAIHLELVCDLTKDAFIGAFRRFTARRGKPSEVWSDNGTNFKGAHSELLELASFLDSDSHHPPLELSFIIEAELAFLGSVVHGVHKRATAKNQINGKLSKVPYEKITFHRCNGKLVESQSYTQVLMV
nr:unnamed protein product [Callosobruchus chinensis]